MMQVQRVCNYFLVYTPLPQKQYIFLYRALIDIAQFGNTEISAKGLSTTVEALKARLSDSKEQCKLEIEFEVRI